MIVSGKHRIMVFILFGACLTFAGCDGHQNDVEESYSYSFQKEKQIKLDTTRRQITADSVQTLIKLSVIPGNKRVFTFRHEQKRANVMDGGFVEHLYFQLPPHNTSIHLEREQLTEARVFYRRTCFCATIGAVAMTKGYIRGEKLASHLWSVTADLRAPSPPRKSVGIFQRGIYPQLGGNDISFIYKSYVMGLSSRKL